MPSIWRSTETLSQNYGTSYIAITISTELVYAIVNENKIETDNDIIKGGPNAGELPKPRVFNITHS